MSLRPVWQPREPPLPASAVIGTGTVAGRLGRATADRLADGVWLRACAGDDWLVVLGDTHDLPWVDGVRYLGWESGVLLPTTSAPIPGAGYVRPAVGAAAEELVVLLPDAVLVAPMPQRRADPGRLP